LSLFARLMFAFVRRLAVRRGLRPPGEQEPDEEGRQRRQTGIGGETLAYWYLRRQGYTVVSRNYRARHTFGEIDLIGWDGDVLVFVEVKTRTTPTGGPPERTVDADKQQALRRTAREYLSRRRLADASYRFDVLALEAEPGTAPVIRLHKGAFGPA
jgi:putative endonuclease